MKDAGAKEELVAALKGFDRGGDGFASAAELRHTMRSLGLMLTGEEGHEMFRGSTWAAATRPTTRSLCR